MQTECSADLFNFVRVEGRAAVAAFDSGKITSDAAALVLAATDRAIRLIDRFARWFSDNRAPELVEHEVASLVGQRIFGRRETARIVAQIRALAAGAHFIER
jgi:hypothetical protein